VSEVIRIVVCDGLNAKRQQSPVSFHLSGDMLEAADITRDGLAVYSDGFAGFEELTSVADFINGQPFEADQVLLRKIASGLKHSAKRAMNR
jgi:hypothetical protein